MYKFGGAAQVNQNGGQLQVGQGQRQDLQAGTLMSPVGTVQNGSIVPSTQVVLPSQVVLQQQQAAIKQRLNPSQSTIVGLNPGQNRSQPGAAPTFIPVPNGTQSATYFPTSSINRK